MHSFLQRLRDDNPNSEEDFFNSTPYDELKSELGMLLSSRPLYLDLDDIPLVNCSVLNYGIRDFLYTSLAEEGSGVIDNEISSRIALMLRRYEPRLNDAVVEHLFSDDNCSIFSVTAFFFTNRIKFSIKWDKHSGEFSLYE